MNIETHIGEVNTYECIGNAYGRHDYCGFLQRKCESRYGGAFLVVMIGDKRWMGVQSKGPLDKSALDPVINNSKVISDKRIKIATTPGVFRCTKPFNVYQFCWAINVN